MSRRRRRLVPASLVALAVLAACSSGAGSGAGSGSRTTTTERPGPVARVDAAGTVWLCRPGLAGDPCAGDRTAISVDSGGARTTTQAELSPAASRFDCFYVYPTVSSEPGPNADLEVQAAETDTAVSQASRFSQVCNVWAPMYRQVTLSALVSGGLPALNVAYQSLLAGWRDYLANFNQGRPIVFIGHSQGAAMLIRLLHNEVDPNPAVRSRMLVAILAGGNVQVPTGAVVGGVFRHLPLCTATAQTGCVIAYSTFPSQPPPGALFGRPGSGVSLQSLQTTSVGQQVACVNPAALGGGPGGLQPYFPRSGSPPWVTYPGLYRATCESAGGATWLQVDHLSTPGDTRPVVTEPLGPTWGYHVDDVSLALGNLVEDVSAEEAAHGG